MITVLAIIAAVALGLNALGSVALWAAAAVKEISKGKREETDER